MELKAPVKGYRTGTWTHIRGVEYYKSLLEHGWEVNAPQKYSGWTALHYAARECDPASVEYLIQNGADVNVRLASTDTTDGQLSRDGRSLLLPIHCVFRTWGMTRWGWCGTGRIACKCPDCYHGGFLQYPCQYCENAEFWSNRKDRNTLKNGADINEEISLENKFGRSIHISETDMFWKCPFSIHRDILQMTNFQVNKFNTIDRLLDGANLRSRFFWEHLFLYIPLYIRAGGQSTDPVAIQMSLGLAALTNNHRMYNLVFYCNPALVRSLSLEWVLKQRRNVINTWSDAAARILLQIIRVFMQKCSTHRDASIAALSLRARQPDTNDGDIDFKKCETFIDLYDHEEELHPDHLYFVHQSELIPPLLYLAVYEIRGMLLRNSAGCSVFPAIKALAIPQSLKDTLLLKAYSTTEDDEQMVNACVKHS